MLLTRVELIDINDRLYHADVRLSEGRVSEIGTLAPAAGESVIDAGNGLLLPGLSDHHTHLVSYAASLSSVTCGPPEIADGEQLADALNHHSGSGWLRGIGFHESTCPELNRSWLDQHGPQRPIRIQHRSGRLWILNSLALDVIELLAATLADHERSRLTSEDGRLYDVDELLGNLTRNDPPDVGAASRQLASWGVTGINDMTPSNDQDTWQWFRQLQQEGKLLQKVRLSGRPAISQCSDGRSLTIGETKVHLHETALPEFPTLVETIVDCHRQGRRIAIHCVTEVELVFALSALKAAGSTRGDRIEHASVVPPAIIEQLKELELTVVTQPNFIRERGDAYLADIPTSEHNYLYRVRSLALAGIPVAFGTDLPFGDANPWTLLQAATNRKTDAGKTLGVTESLAPMDCLKRLLGPLSEPANPRVIKKGIAADCVLLKQTWNQLEQDFSQASVSATFVDGVQVYNA